MFVFLRKVYITLNFPLGTAFATSFRFCMVVLSLLFVSRYSFFQLFILCWDMADKTMF